MFRLSASREDYLKTVYRLDAGGTGTRVKDVALALGVTMASTSRALKELEQNGFLYRVDKHLLALTDTGRRAARELKSRYEIIRLFFIEVLHVHCKTAAEEACKLEHTLSDTSVLAMQLLLDEKTDWAELADLVSA